MSKLYAQYFTDFSEKQIQQLQHFEELILDWNSKINLISKKDTQNLDVHHILHALSIAKYIQFQPGTKVLDIGTGGGFPGIPLAIAFPEVQFCLVDSIGKKIKVVQEIVEALDLKNVEAIQTRAEELKRKFNFVVSRGVSSFEKFLPFTKNKYLPTDNNALPNGLLYLKGGEVAQELKNLKIGFADVVELADYYTEDFFESKKLVYISN